MGNMKIDVDTRRERKPEVPNQDFLKLKKALEEQTTPLDDKETKTEVV